MKTNKSLIINFSVILLSLFFLFGCQSSSNQTVKNDPTLNNTVENTENISESIRSIFYNIPSPLEMANIIHQHNLIYDPLVLSGFGREKQLLTQEYQALNLGVYGADFSCCNVFEQMQDAIKYLSSIRALTQILQIPPEESNQIVERLENNIEYRDSLILFVTSLFLNADSYLKENQRQGTAVLILLGSWVEGMYIATHLKLANNREDFKERIAEQKFSFFNIYRLFETHKKNNQLTKDIFAKLIDIKAIYDQVIIRSNNVEIEIFSEYKKAVLRADGTIEIPETMLPQLKENLSELRTLILNKN